MPIDAETFERGEQRASVEDRIRAFFREHPERAYDTHEVAVAVTDVDASSVPSELPRELVGDVQYVLGLTTVYTLLEELVDNGALDRRVVEREEGPRSYYREPRV